MRTLVISDLHLGSRTKADVLRDPHHRGRLLSSLSGVERLVLLGDVVELRHGPTREALAAASEPLRGIGEALGEGGEVVVVPGNHDHRLAAPWLERRARREQPRSLGLESEVDWRAGEPLATLARCLKPARVRAAYPGVWLREDVYATHGHYCDRHTTVPMLERLAAGAMARLVGEPPEGPCSAEDYELELAPIYAWIDAIAQRLRSERRLYGTSGRTWRALEGAGQRAPSIRRRAAKAAFALAVATLNRVGLGPLRSSLSPSELRRAGVAAFAQVAVRLGIAADHVIFGHTHRAGPLDRDRTSEWSATTGARLLNSGCWVYEPEFLGAAPERSPYRAGFAVAVQDGREPQLVNLLD